MKEVPRTPATLADADQELAPVLDARDEAVNYADWIVEMAGPDLAGHVLELGAGHGTITERLGVGAVAWWLVVRQLRRFPRTGASIRAYDRIVTPLVRRLESRWRPPFGQSVLCIGRRPLTLADG